MFRKPVFSLGQDLLYNSSKCAGFIYNILKYRKERAKKVAKKNNNNIDIESDNHFEAEAIDVVQNLTLDEEITDEDRK